MQHQVPSHTITTALASAVHEWFLIFLLLIDASFSYLITKFASYYHLQTPCILCSRIDHILRNEKTEFCWDLLCKKHKVKISSLVLCSLHQSLVDVHELCENCLFSFATVNKSNAETYRLLVGKLGDEPHRGSSDFNGGRRQCSCCNAELVSRSNDQMVFDKMSLKHEPVELYKPLLETDGQDTVELRDITDVALSRNAGDLLGKDDDIDLLPHVEYQKVNIASDTESKASLSDDDSACSAAHLTKYDQRDLNAADDTEKLSLIDDLTSEKLSLIDDRTSEKKPRSGKDDDGDLLPHVGYQKVDIASDTESKASLSDDDGTFLAAHLTKFDQRDLNADDDTEKLSLFDDLTSVKLIHPAIVIEPYFLESKVEVKNGNLHGTESPELIRFGIEDEELNSPRVEPKSSISERAESSQTVSDNGTLTEKLSIIDDLTSEKLIHPAVVIEPSLLESIVEVKNGNLHGAESPEPIRHGTEELNFSPVEPESGTCERDEASHIVSVSGTLTPSIADQYSVDVSEGTVDVKRVGEPSKDAVKNGETRTLSTIVSANDRLLVFKPSLNDNTSQILELGDAYKLAIGSRGRQLSGKLLEQISLKDSTKLSDDLKFLLSQLSFVRGNDLSSSEVSPRISGNIGMQILQRRASLERNVSGISLDESIISEIEGENLVDRLKRQVDHDRKIMSSLYKELEEERNASTVAVNEAMAMITRLQEEKSSLQMEALQCLRMMEEQAEYDNENLQKANDIIAQKEKETQDLEAELEFYKKKLSDSCPADNKTDENSEIDVQEQEEGSSKESNTNVDESDVPADDLMDCTQLDFDNSAHFILKDL